ncbi:MAG: hypothetical protein AAF828_07245 [Bacteroidota bacterium]
MLTLLRNIVRSFPIQLLLLHLRSNLFLLIIWVTLVFMISGWLGKDLGSQYLFLDAEYLGTVGFLSFLFMGLAFGFMVMSWNLSTYLLLARNFGFLACLARPFLKFCINNAILPLGVLVAYSFQLYRFNRETASFLGEWGGLMSGLILSLILYMIYFYLTNRDVYYYSGRRPSAPNLAVRQPFGRQIDQTLDAVQYRENPYRIRSYLNNRLQNKLVRSVAHYDRATLENVFRQNHWNAVFLQLTSFVFLVLLGLLIDYPIFQFPAGASVMVLLSLVIFVIGAISYWFSEWRITILLLVLLGINWVTSLDLFQRSNYAYGMDYDRSSIPYNEEHLKTIAASKLSLTDSLNTIQLLDNWKARQPGKSPKMVILCTSGGGLTAALWSIQVLQQLEKATAGKIFPATMLMTGASGGMLGVAYMREVYYRQLLGEPLNYQSATLLDDISADLLNPIAFSIVSNDIFLPFTKVKIGDETYLRDRAYSFERQFNQNTHYLLDRSLADYHRPEMNGQIPMMILTPSIVNDGRRLSISPQGTSYLMTSTAGRQTQNPLQPDAVDLAALLGKEQRDSLRFLTALRMNATYPYVLPFVQLPTTPAVKVMDAGYRDNYGILTASRFVQVFADWIKDSTCEVLLIQISAFKGEQNSRDQNANQGLLESLFAPLGLAQNFTSVQSHEQENTLSYLYETLGPDHFKLIRFNYEEASDDELRASISFHLTQTEKAEIIEAIHLPEHRENIEAVRRFFARDARLRPEE